MKEYQNYVKINKKNYLESSIALYLLFYILIIITNINSVKYFRAYNLLSQKILLISDEGISFFELEFENITSILDLNNTITSEEDLQFVSLIQPSYYNGNIFCRIKENIYIISSNDFSLIKAFSLTQIINKEISLIPYEDIYGNNYFFICYINDSKELQIEKYSAAEDSIYISINNINKEIEYENGTTEKSKNNGISCQLMHLSEYDYDLLICFIQSESNVLNGLIFDPENLSYLFLVPNKTIDIEINIIKSTLSPDKTNCLICYEGNPDYPSFECIIFNIENKIWSDYYQFIYNAYINILFDFNVYYIDVNNEYFIYFSFTSNSYYIIQLDEEFSVKNSNSNNKCILKYQIQEYPIKYSSTALYSNNKYIIILSYNTNDNDYFTFLQIDNFCSYQIDFNGFNINQQPWTSLPDFSSTIISTNIFSTEIDKISSSLLETTLFSKELESTLITSTFLFSQTEEKNNNDDGKKIFCPADFPYEIIEECETEDFFNRICKINNNSTIVLEKTINFIKNNIIKRKINSLLTKIIEEKEDLIVKEENIIYQITSTENQNNNNYYNISSIQLGECENKLKKYNNISQNESLFIFKIDYYIPEYLIPIIEYEVYNPYTKEPLNLGICDEESINISIPVIIDENEIFKYNPNSSFYNDICFPYKTENGTDITLNDRKNEYNNKNLSLCEKNCQFSQYKIEPKNVICECEIKNKFDQLSYIENNKAKILNYFISFDKITNFNIIKCFKTLFCIEGIKNNIGSYIILFIIFFDFVSIIIFYCKDYKEIKSLINQLIKLGNLNEIKKFDEDNKINQKNKKKFKRRQHKNNTNNKNKVKRKNKKAKKIPSNPPKNKNNKNNNIYDFNNTIFNNRENISKSFLKDYQGGLNSYKQQNIRISIINYNNYKISKKQKKKNLITNKDILQFNDTELNFLSYEEALKYDKRTYFQYYLSLIKTKHLLLFTFYTSNDYNSRIIKICFFLFSFELLITVSSLFFQDETMHKIYENDGLLDIIHQLPPIIYSSLISILITTIVKLLSLTERNIIQIKKEASLNSINEKTKKRIKIINLKFIVFFILNIIFSFLFWYYLACFCAVYKNTQMHLLKSALISFSLSMAYPLPINLLPGIMRIPSLRDINKNKSNLYIISKFIQTI